MISARVDGIKIPLKIIGRIVDTKQPVTIDLVSIEQHMVKLGYMKEEIFCRKFEISHSVEYYRIFMNGCNTWENVSLQLRDKILCKVSSELSSQT